MNQEVFLGCKIKKARDIRRPKFVGAFSEVPAGNDQSGFLTSDLRSIEILYLTRGHSMPSVPRETWLAVQSPTDYVHPHQE